LALAKLGGGAVICAPEADGGDGRDFGAGRSGARKPPSAGGIDVVTVVVVVAVVAGRADATDACTFRVAVTLGGCGENAPERAVPGDAAAEAGPTPGDDPRALGIAPDEGACGARELVAANLDELPAFDEGPGPCGWE
jgi:hypothetical protein